MVSESVDASAYTPNDEIARDGWTHHAGHVKDVDEVVQHDITTKQLLPDLHTETDEGTLPHTLGEEIQIANVPGLVGNLDGFADLLELSDDDGVVLVALGVQVGEELVGLPPSGRGWPASEGTLGRKRGRR
jgi:hypothetical protein